VTGARLTEVAPVVTRGRNFRRLLARDVAPTEVVRIDVPTATSDIRSRFLLAVAAISVLAMLVALSYAFARRRTRAVAVPAISPTGMATQMPANSRPSEMLVREIATLDAHFEQQRSRSPEDRARYDEARAALKAKLASALAVERQPE
jgi:hypothetical protein